MIYLVRHAEAAAAWGEHPDPGLSDKGWLQAEAGAKRLMALPIQQAICSPMKRCRDTASAYKDLTSTYCRVEPCVTEIPTPDTVEERRTWLRDLMAGQWADAPSMVQDWRNTLLETVHALEDETVVFSHFIAINAIVGELTGSSSVTVFRPNYCSITMLETTANGLSVAELGESLDTRVL